MARTTVNLDAPILREVQAMGHKEKKSLGRLMSELLADALSRRRAAKKDLPVFRWSARSTEARVDLLDKEKVWAALDKEKVWVALDHEEKKGRR